MADGFAAYDRGTLDRFFAEARSERERLLYEIAGARRRILRAETAFASSGAANGSIHAVLELQRQLREESRTNERVIAEIQAEARAQAEQIMRKAMGGASRGRPGQAGLR